MPTNDFVKMGFPNGKLWRRGKIYIYFRSFINNNFRHDTRYAAGELFESKLAGTKISSYSQNNKYLFVLFSRYFFREGS